MDLIQRKNKAINDLNNFILNNSLNLKIIKINDKYDRLFAEFLCKSNHTFERRIDTFKQGAYNCPICEKEKLKIHPLNPTKERIEKDKNMINTFLKDINEEDRYINLIYKYEIRESGNGFRLYIETNDNCGHENYITRFDKFKKGSRCPNKECRYKRSSITLTKSHDTYNEIINFINSNKNYNFYYKDLEKSIIHMPTHGYKLNLYCKKCKKLYQTWFYNLKRGCNCPCTYGNSKGEEKIKNLLDNLNLKYTSQKTFLDLKYKSNLKFDFFLEDYNTVIEFDGDQHYKGWNNNEESLKLNKIRDSIKNNYCELHNFNLIRLDRKDYNNLEEVLINDLCELDIIKN